MFTAADYANWPDSFEQSARDRAAREARDKQLTLAFPPDEDQDEEVLHAQAA